MSCFNSPPPANRPAITFHCDYGFDNIFQYEVPLNLPSHHATFLVCSCNGLLCLNFCPPRTMINVIYVWNPNTSESYRGCLILVKANHTLCHLDGEHLGRCLMLFRGKLALIRFVSVG